MKIEPKREIRILQLISRTDVGGGTTYLISLLRNVNRIGNEDIKLYLAAPIDGLKKNSKSFGIVKHLDIKARSFSISDYFKIISFCKKNDIKIIHSHGFGAGIYSRLVLLFLDCKICHTFHGLHYQKNLRANLKQCVEYWLSYLTDVAIFCSDDEMSVSKVLKLKSKRELLLRNFVENRKKEKHSFSEVRAIGVVARNDHIKGLDLLAKKLNRLFKIRPDIIVKFAGIESFQIGVQDEYLKNLKFLGSLKHMEEFYKNIDVLISNSREEGMPLSVLEAISSGVPCILSDVRGHSYFIENNAAFGIELEDENALVNLLDNNNFSTEANFKINNASSLLEKNHNIDSQLKVLINLYRELFLII
jgi:glycosyltransferase involved in cell wall biosynthesis